MSEKKLTAISVAIEVRKLNNILCHIIDGKESVALIDAYAAQCVKEARERLVAEIKRRIDKSEDGGIGSSDIDAAFKATE